MRTTSFSIRSLRGAGLSLAAIVSTACGTSVEIPAPAPSSATDGGLSTAPDGAAAADAGGPVARGPAAKLPKPTGTCPAIVAGDVTFAPAGAPPRKVKIALDPAAAKGPLLLYWHATGSSPAEAAYTLGASQAAFTSAGGVVAIPYADPAAGQFEWFIVNQSPKLDDFIVADEVVACLAEAGRIDTNRVHATGMSAGGLQTTALGFYRPAYVASVATFSGGLPAGFNPPAEASENKLAAFIFNGGATDSVYGVDFAAASERYRSTLRAAGHFTAMCDHGKGHTIPRDAAPSVLEFFAAHAFGVSPSPYAGGLPASFPTYCKL